VSLGAENYGVSRRAATCPFAGSATGARLIRCNITFVKWFKGNDIWAIVVVHQADAVDTDSVPEQISQVLSDFQDLFVEPTELPPHRDYDHVIPLFSNAVPVNSTPYGTPHFTKMKLNSRSRCCWNLG
jgi:hypothetical protein